MTAAGVYDLLHLNYDDDLIFNICFDKIKTKRGRDAIKIQNEVFVFKKFNKNETIYWRCQNYNCPASVTTYEDRACINDAEHSHDRQSNVERKFIMIEELIIKRAIDEDTSIPKIYADELNNVVTEGLNHEQVAAFLNINKNINLDNKFGLTTDNKPFVLFDSNDQDRILGFCSPVGLEILKRTKQIHIDGTFKSTPRIYYQTFGLHSWIFSQMFPSVYVLLGQKSERIYKKMLFLLKEACFEHGIILNFETLVSDFELASINAFKFHFPNIKVIGCQYHYAQAIRRNVDTNGLKIAYNSNDDIQYFIKSFIALSMVPLENIDDAFGIILERKNELFEKLKTNETESLNTENSNLLIVGRGSRSSRSRGRGRGRGRERGRGRVQSVEDTPNVIHPQPDLCKLIENFVAYFVDTWFEGCFDVAMWNHANTIGPRTNNHVEGFHNKLNKWIQKPHPDTYQLISVFQKIDNKVSIDYQTRLLGNSAPKRRAIDIEKDNKYSNLMDLLRNGDIDLKQYMRSCTYLVNFDNIMNLI
ncbi:unnamed protein product [Brachionus calyciflorus]|uniref:MULE transposase domain-containing protein n=1 Tax=Brachionus calyciflorus TaxID=104777 RepID=A0A813N3R5_9BILA|nr:unnamed protein product [Brachionus calyciflorus]